MSRAGRVLALLFVFLFAANGADLAALNSEPNLEKRARKALELAAGALRRAQETYARGETQPTDAALSDLAEYVRFAWQSLRQTGKDPHRSPKQFKYAEIQTREMARRLNDFREQMSPEDRERADQVRGEVREVHDELLLGIMGSNQRERPAKR